MRESQRSELRRAIVAAGILLIGVIGVLAGQQSRAELREEFHQTYPLAANGRVSLENINGAVRIASWERNEVRVDAVKRAYTNERLQEAEIRVDAGPDAIRIKTLYPMTSNTFTDDEDRRYNNPASVEYTLTVPRSARLESIELINGALDIEGIAGEVKASSINGRVRARGLTGEAKLSVINGQLEATFDRLEEAKPITLNSVNGSITLVIPSDANAELKANTVHGGITNDFNLPVRRGEYVGSDLAGVLGRGGARVRLNNVNGKIEIRRASDGRPLSPPRNLLPETRKDDVHIDGEEIQRDRERARRDREREIRDAQRERERAVREVQRETREIQRQIAREARELARVHVEREVKRTSSGHSLRTERESKSFTTSGAPRVRVETFDGPISVHAWDKPEVMFTAIKRAHDEGGMKGINVRAEQRGAEVIIIAEPDKNAARNDDGDTSDGSVELDVYVPRNTTLRASSGDGRLIIEGINGEVDINTGDGSIDVSGGRGRLRANTGDGRIRIVDFDGEADARTGDGRITLEGRFVQLAARTGDGSISLALPAGSNAIIETNAESVISDGLTAVAENAGDATAAGRTRRFRIGNGGTVFTLRTGDGQVVLRQR